MLEIFMGKIQGKVYIGSFKFLSAVPELAVDPLNQEFPYHFILLCFSLRRQVAAINKMAEAGTFFWDYGNAFLLESSRAGMDRVQSLEYRVQSVHNMYNISIVHVHTSIVYFK